MKDNFTFQTRPKKELKRTSFKKKITIPMKKTRLNKKTKSHTAGWWQKKCDDLLQDINRLKFVQCEVCGGKNEVAHHVITKALSSFLRYNLANLAHICFNCHFRHHIQSDPSILAKLIEIRGKEWYDWLENVRRTPQQTGIKYYQGVYEELEKMKSELSTVKDLQ